MGTVQNARTAVEVVTDERGKVRSARTASEVITQQRGKLIQAREATEILTQQRGKVRTGRSAVEVMLMNSPFKDFMWGPPIGHFVNDQPGFVRHSFSGGDTSAIPAGEKGPAPVEYNGDWSVNGGNLLAPASGEAVIGWDVAHTNYEFTFTIVNIAVDPGPCVRLQNAANYILCQMNSGGASGIYQRVGGGYGQLSPSYSIPWANGDVVRVVNTPERVDVYRNGVLVMGVATTQFASEPRVGFRTNGGACRFDDIVVQDITPASVIQIPGMYATGAIDGLTGSAPFNIPIPADRQVGDLAIISYGHRNLTTVPDGCTFRASSLGGQSTANQQECRTHTKELSSTDVANGYVQVNPGAAGTVYGLVWSVQLVRSSNPAYKVAFDVAASGPTTTNNTSKTTPLLTFGGVGRHVFHQAMFFQNSGGAKAWSFPTALDQSESSVNREYGAICREPYDLAATSNPARTWSISGGVNGGVGTTAVAVYLVPV